MRSIEFAIQLEQDGRKYYEEQAEKQDHSSLKTVFLMLAKDEARHEQILLDLANKMPVDSLEALPRDDYEKIFKDHSPFYRGFKETPDQVDIYLKALDKEQETIDLYKLMLKEATSEADKKIFEFLIKEEKAHFRILEEISSHVIKAQDWVEDAEFGRREEY